MDVSKGKQGFASMDPVVQKSIASKGGRSAHQQGKAHEWTSEAAREAGRKGGYAVQLKRQQAQQAARTGVV